MGKSYSKYRWNLPELCQQADAFQVAEMIGMRIRKAGSTIFVENVEGRTETALTHCQLFHTGMRDYSIAQSYTTYNMVKEYYANILGKPLSHDEICTILADTCGGADAFRELKEERKNGVKAPKFPMKPEDFALIGLAPKNRWHREVVSWQSWKDEEHTEKHEDGFAKTKALPVPSIYTLFREDPEAFWYLVSSKTRNKLESTELSILELENLKDSGDGLKDAYLKKMRDELAQLKNLKSRLERYLNRDRPDFIKNRVVPVKAAS